MYLETSNKYECCGCGACKNICPQACIKMETDEQGFLYPVIKDKEKCINCGLCKRVCVFNEKQQIINGNPDCYYGWHRDDRLRQESTSGAAFYAITQVCQEIGYSYYSGAVYDLNNKVVHICTDKISDILDMRSSKYVQSDLKNVFCEIKDVLKTGKKVVFSGTPCQVDALLSYVGKKLNKDLLTIALVCHGVSSPLCFEEYKKSIEKKYNSEIKSIRFRDKKIKDGFMNHKFTSVQMKNGLCDDSTENPYALMFGLGFMHRKSCSNCQYATPLRNFDLTIGDFWGIQMTYPELEKEISNGISLILVHSEKGQEIVCKLNKYMKLEKTPSYLTCVNKVQQQLYKPFDENKMRDSFIHKVVSKKDYIHEANKILIVRKIKKSLRIRIKKMIEKMRRR